MANGHSRKRQRSTRHSKGASRRHVTAGTVKKIVRSLQPKPEIKHYQAVGSLAQVTSTATSFSPHFLNVSQGVGTSQRVGNDIHWKSFYTEMQFRSHPTTTTNTICRAILYIPKAGATTDMVNQVPAVTLWSFIDVNEYILLKDIRFELKEGGGTASATNLLAMKTLINARRLKKPKLVSFANSAAVQPVEPLAKWLLLSDKAAGSAPTLDYKHSDYYYDN